MRKLMLTVVALIAVVTFIRAYTGSTIANASDVSAKAAFSAPLD